MQASHVFCQTDELILCQNFLSLPRDALMHSAVLRLHVVRLSVRLSVCMFTLRWLGFEKHCGADHSVIRPDCGRTHDTC